MTEHWSYSPYTVWLNPSDTPHCLAVAYDVPFKETTYNRLKNMAEQNYEYKLMIDDLPSATAYKSHFNNITEKEE